MSRISKLWTPPMPAFGSFLRRAAIPLVMAAGFGTVLAVSILPSLTGRGTAAKAPPPAPAKPAPVKKPAAQPQAAAGYTVKRILPIAGPMHLGDWHWDDKGVPEGKIVVTVDLAAQVLSVFRNGYEIGTAAILYGADEKPTPLGIFAVTQKDADHVSNIYDAPMPYMLRLTNDGVSIHGSKVENGYMTHGCVGVPTPFAKRLFGQVKLGDTVIVTRGETLDLGQAINAV